MPQCDLVQPTNDKRSIVDPLEHGDELVAGANVFSKSAINRAITRKADS